jgi:hypothetical protein
MRAAVNHVGHRDRQHFGIWPAKILEKRNADSLRRGLGRPERNGEDCVGAELGLGFGAIQLEHGLIYGQLVERINPLHRWEDFLRHVLDRLGDALAQEPLLVTVPQLDGFMLPGARARRHSGPSNCASGQDHIHFHGRIAARIQDFARFDIINRAHNLNFKFQFLLKGPRMIEGASNESRTWRIFPNPGHGARLTADPQRFRNSRARRGPRPVSGPAASARKRCQFQAWRRFVGRRGGRRTS